MVSQIDSTKWFELTEDSDTDDELHHKKFSESGLHKSYDDLKKLQRSEDQSLSQYSLQTTRLSAGDHADFSKSYKLRDPTLSQYSLGESQLSEGDSKDLSKSETKMEKGDDQKFDAESLRLQFQTLLTDDSEEADSTQLSSASDQQGSTTDDPWRSATETSDGPSLSEYPLQSHKVGLEDGGQTVTEDSSECEEVLHTAISEVSKDFISGNLSSYPIQLGDSDLSSDDQKVLQKHLSVSGKYPETAAMSDSDWNITDTDTVSPRTERAKTESNLSSVSSFSPPFSSTILTNSSTVSGKPGHGLSMIQEASVEDTVSFKELPADVSVSTSKGSFLGRDHQKYIDSMRTVQSNSSQSSDNTSLKKTSQNVTESDTSNREFESSRTSVDANFNKSSNALTSGEESTESGVRRSGYTTSNTTTSMVRDSPAGGAASSLPQTSPLMYLDTFPTTVDLARKSEQILDKTLSKLNLKGSVGRYSYPFSNTSSPSVRDEYKRYSMGHLDTYPYTVPRFAVSRQEDLVKSLSSSSRSHQSEDLTRSVKSESSHSVPSDEVSKLMAKNGSSQQVKRSELSASDRDQTDTQDRSQREVPPPQSKNITSRVDSVLSQTAYIDRFSSLPPGVNANRNTSHGSDSPPPPPPPPPPLSAHINQRDSRDYPPPPPLPGGSSQLPLSDQHLPPPVDAAASLDYQRLQKDLQEIQNSLQNNLDFDSGNDSVQSSDVDIERERILKTPVGSDAGSDIVPSTTTTPDRSRRLMWDYGADIASEQPGRFTSRESDATESESENRTGSYVDQAQVAHNASRRQPYNSEGEETHTSGSSGAKFEDVARGQGTDEEHHTSRTNTPIGRDADEILNSFRAQRSMLETQYLCGMANQVSQILSQQDPEKQAHGILSEVQTQEHELLTRLANRPPLDSSFTDTSANLSNRSLVISDSDVKRRLEMSGLSSPDRNRTLGNTSFMEFSTPRKIANPFEAFSNAKTFLSSQLEEMSNKTFNHSIELRTPLRQVVNCYPLYGVSKDGDEKKTTGGAATEPAPRTDDRDAGPLDKSNNRNGRGQPEGLAPDDHSSTRLAPVTAPSVETIPSMTDRRAASSRNRDVSDGVESTQSLTERHGVSTSNRDVLEGVEATNSMTDRRAVSSSRDFSNRVATLEMVSSSDGGEQYKERVSGDKGSPSSSSPADLTQYRDKLRPYRPAGSRDLYYTESDTGSMADSVTTMESTHTGSDDAVGPSFHPSVLGSRQDGQSQQSAARKHQPQGMQLEQALSTIEEKSVMDERDKTSTGSMNQGDSRQGMKSWDTRQERALDGGRSHSTKDTLSKLEARAELDTESGIGTRSHLTSMGHMTDTSQDRQSRAGAMNWSSEGQSGGVSDRLERDETLRAARRVLQDNYTRESNPDQKYDSRLQGSADQELTRTSYTNKQLDQDRLLGDFGSRVGQHVSSISGGNSGLGSYSDRRQVKEYDSHLHSADSRPGQTLDSRQSQDLGSRSGQNLTSSSGQTLSSRSAQDLRSGVDQIKSSDSFIYSHPARRDIQDQDPFEGRLRSRSDGDLSKHSGSTSPARDGQLPEPYPLQSPIHPRSTLRESQLRTDPRHSTAIDSSMDHRMSSERGRDNSRQHQDRAGMDMDQQAHSNGRDGRPRSSDRKDNRQRMEQNRKARRGQIDVSSSEDDTTRAIDSAPLSRPAQILRETLEQEIDPNIPVNINQLWERFQELNPTDSDTSLNTTRMEKLAHLLRNPAKHLVTSYFEERESNRKTEEEKAAYEREKRREERRNQKMRNTSETESNGSYIEVTNQDRNGRKTSKSSSVKKMKKNSKVDGSVDGENLYSIPEDMSFDQKRSKKPTDLIDPNMEKLREKIERQKEKIEYERRKELKRMEKLVKLESLLSAKKRGKISESTLIDQLEYISTTSVPTDSTGEITESTLTVSGTNSEILTDDSTTAKDSSLEMQMVKYARNFDSRCEDEPVPLEVQIPRGVEFDDRSRKAEKLRMNEKLKEQLRNDGDKNRKLLKKKEEESLYDYREVDIQIVDKSRRTDFSPDSNKRSGSNGRTRDAATNYPSPAWKSPQSQRRSKQRKTKSEAIQTSPYRPQKNSKRRSPSPNHRHKQVTAAPFSLQEKSRSPSPPYSRHFTPESMARSQPRMQQKLPASPKGIAWFVEVKEDRPWRKPLKERQTFAARQAWVPDSRSQWQTADPQDVNEDEENEVPLETRFVVDRLEKDDISSKLIDENYTSKKTPSLQEAFNQRMQKFVSQSRERLKRMALAAEHRQMQDALRQERERIFADKRKQDANLNAHPYSENLLRPRKRVFTRQEQKEMTKKKYNRLPEVIQREENEKRQNQYKLNRLRAKVFTKRVQRHVLIKAGSY